MNPLNDLLGLIYPNICRVCGKSLFRHEKILCMKCFHHLPSARFKNDRNNPAAQVFWGRVPFQFVITALLYNKGNAVQKLVHELKYRSSRETGIFLGEILGKEIAQKVPDAVIECIMPVPLHPKKQKKRGYNQSELLARGMSGILDIPVDISHLYRREFSSTQTRKSKYQRWQNVENIFAVKKAEELQGRNILLVDDVITTGATLEACARQLLQIEGLKLSVGAVAFTKK